MTPVAAFGWNKEIVLYSPVQHLHERHLKAVILGAAEIVYPSYRTWVRNGKGGLVSVRLPDVTRDFFRKTIFSAAQLDIFCGVSGTL